MKSELKKCDEDECVDILPHRFYQHDSRREQGMLPCAGSLLKQFTKVDDSDMSKIVCCRFSPTDDNVLILSALVNGRTSGYVQMWDLEGVDELMIPVPVSSNFFTYSPLPSCQFSSNGELVSAILNSSVNHLTILATDEEYGLCRCIMQCDGNSLLRGRVLCCIFSEDNQKAVTVSNMGFPAHNLLDRSSASNKICIWRITSHQPMKLKCMWQESCETLCQELKGDIHSCVLCPNGNYLAISSTSGQSFILDCTIFSTLHTTRYACSGEHDGPLTCLFNPQFASKLLCCHNNTWCCCYNFETGLLRKCITNHVIEDESITANACAFSPDGESFAIALSNATVVLCDSDSLEQLFVIEQSPTPLSPQQGAYSLAISRSCQELAVGYNDGFVAVWQLPPKLGLKHLCRMVILKLVTRNAVPLLPLPGTLKSYLLYSYQRQLNLHQGIK